MRKLINLGSLGLAAAALIAAAPAFKINNETRPAVDVTHDADRKPAETVKLARIGTGQTIVDLLPGTGYFTRVFSQAVGPKGKVVALVADQYAAASPEARTVIEALAAERGYGNVQAAIRSLGDIGAPGSVDRVFTAQNYHDLKSKNLPAETAMGVNQAVFAALKPGGYYIVIDHRAAPGSGLRDVDTLHRIDAATVKAEVIAAGFRFDGESMLLSNGSDDRTKAVFDPSVKGRTNQFFYRFVKPVKK